MMYGIQVTGRRLRLAALAIGLALLATPAAAQQQHFPSNSDLQVMLRYLVEDGETPGIAVGILEADGSTRIVVYGDAGAGARPLGPRSVFEIGSINKTFTGALLALAAARGELALNDPVARHLPPHVTVPSRNGREITLLDLATHRSGLPRLPDNHRPADPANPYADYTIEQLYQFLSNHTLRRDPGADGEYSNLGFGLLGHALARAAGKSYVALVRERILQPLGMTMSGWEMEGEIAAWSTKGHRAGQVVPYWFATEAILGAGGLRSSMEDMLKYLRANVAPPDNELGRAMRAAQQVQRPMPGDGGWGIGLAWQVQTFQGRSLVQHGGGTGGYHTYLAFDPVQRVGIVLLTNTTGFDDDIERDFLRRGPPIAVTEVNLPRRTLESYVGEYQVGSQSLFIRLEDDGALTLQGRANVRFRLYAASDSAFVVKRAPMRVAFTRDGAGEVRLVVNQEGTDRTARRVSRETPPPAIVAGNATLDLPLTPAEMARYEGSYTLTMGTLTRGLRIYVEGGRLMAHPEGQSPSRLRYQGDHAFVRESDPAVRLVFTLANDRAEGVTLQQSGRAAIPGQRNP